MMIRQMLTGVAVVLLAVSTATGCAGGGSGGGGGDTRETKDDTVRTTMFQVAKCMRDNGHPTFPDPVQDKKGRWDFPPSVGNMRAPVACDALMRRMKQQNPGRRPPSAADMTKLRQFAQCMRRHGVSEWPDPSADGTFKLPEALMRESRQALGVRACRKLAPGGRWEVSPTSEGR